MHNAAFAALDLAWRYQALETVRESLPEALARLRGEAWAGANVTVPHKERVMDLLDEVTPLAGAVGAVNTIVKEGGRLRGDNTDAAGFLADLQEQGVDVGGRPALILGAGGAARAVAAALAGAGATLRWVCRNPRRGRDIAGKLGGVGGGQIAVYAWGPEAFASAGRGCALIVNATPLGMAPQVEASPWPPEVPFPPGAFVYDLVYNPPATKLVQQARAAGLGSCGGLGMLLEQGARSFRLWTGLEPPRQVMLAAARSALERQHASFPHRR
jgi:shikimate dehydrogenase